MTGDPLPFDLTKYSAGHRARQRGHENGTVDKTGKREKKWRGWYHDYRRSADGTEMRIKRQRIIGPVARMTKAEAEEEHRVWIRRRYSLPAAETAAATVATLCDDLFQLKTSDWEEATQKTNASVFGLIKAGLGGMVLDQVKPDDLKRFINSLPNRTWKTPTGKAKTGVSQSYVKKTITQLRAVFDLAHEKEFIRKNPARSINIRLSVPKKARRPDKTVFPPADLRLLLEALDERDRLIVWVSMLGGPRPNELFAVCGRDVGPYWIHIGKALDRRRRLKETKTDRSRYANVPPQIADEVQGWIAKNGIGMNDLVFQNTVGGPINRGNFLKRRLRAAARRAGVVTLDVDFQMLRRSFATLATVAGLDIKEVQSQLGHARPDMTLLEYVQTLDPVMMGKLDTLYGMLKGAIPMPPDMTAKLGSKLVN